jgi:hypothetical protein
MAGKRGRSGRRPLPVATHLLRGTFRADRHGPRPVMTAGSAALTLPVAPVTPVPAAVVEGLQAPGLAFVLDVWIHYGDWSPAAVALLRQAGQVVDAIEAYQARIAVDGCLVAGARGTTFAHPLLRAQHQARATLLAIVSALDLKED